MRGPELSLKTNPDLAMKIAVALAFLLGVCACAAEIEQRIVNGVDATYGDHPYICSLQRRSGTAWYHTCGCMIYNQRTVITAAHCVDGAAASALRIGAGEHIISQVDAYQVNININAYRMHPSYSATAAGYPNDIATLQLASALTFNSHINTIPFDTSASTNWAGTTCVLSGWGRTVGGGATADTLKKVNINSISNTECSQRWVGISGATINSGHICFYNNIGSSCNGDSGGPAKCNGVLTGVTSWGISTCDGTRPSVYTRIGYFYSWIVANAY